MPYRIILAPEAVEDLKALRAFDRTAVRKAIKEHLSFQPAKTSKSRIKRLRRMRHPQYRLRVEEIRVFYDVTERVARSPAPHCPRPPRPGSLAPNIGDHGPSDSALAAASGWRQSRPAAARHAARCASRDLCSGARHLAPCALEGRVDNGLSTLAYRP